MRIFVLGALDPEMREIQEVLKAAKEQFCFASFEGHRVRRETAYLATGLSRKIPEEASLVFVECDVKGLYTSSRIDHHYEGDPGYDCDPAQYFEGSSLGQLLIMLGHEATHRQRIICAADHCLEAAYRGECPGIDPQDLARWRTANRARTRSIPEAQLEAEVLEAKAQLDHAERILIQGVPVAWLDKEPSEADEAAARFGIPFMASRQVPDGRQKVHIMDAPPHVIRHWMDECGLVQVYGNPKRGYAGGYLSAR